ncbi:hypothetical protein NXS19_010388 [Fusarium pseudograminearum]|nr:hypothetical protein NXS19_010388 [Fusarium pseudograminearum]
MGSSTTRGCQQSIRGCNAPKWSMVEVGGGRRWSRLGPWLKSAFDTVGDLAICLPSRALDSVVKINWLDQGK